eukprot:3725749-Rhodomonas_salina.1
MEKKEKKEKKKREMQTGVAKDGVLLVAGPDHAAHNRPRIEADANHNVPHLWLVRGFVGQSGRSTLAEAMASMEKVAIRTWKEHSLGQYRTPRSKCVGTLRGSCYVSTGSRVAVGGRARSVLQMRRGVAVSVPDTA